MTGVEQADLRPNIDATMQVTMTLDVSRNITQHNLPHKLFWG